MINVLKNRIFSDMNATKTTRNIRFTIYTTEDIKESVDTTFSIIPVEKQIFLSNLLEDLSSDSYLLSFLQEYQITKAMGRKRITEQDIDKLTGAEAKRLVMIETKLNFLARKKFNANNENDFALVDEIAEKVTALNNEMAEIKKTAFARETEEIQES